MSNLFNVIKDSCCYSVINFPIYLFIYLFILFTILFDVGHKIIARLIKSNLTIN